MNDPYTKETYCGGCHVTKTHYLKASLTDNKATCYECPACLHLVFSRRSIVEVPDDQC